jgi:hypothetical protein
MFKEYKEWTQKSKVITILIMKNKPCRNWECENHKDIFVWAKAWSRLSELLNDWVVEVKYLENPSTYKCKNGVELRGYHIAEYILTDEAKEFYKKLYNIKTGFFSKLFN